MTRHDTRCIVFAIVICTLNLGGSIPTLASEVEIINLYDAFGNTPKGAVQDFGFSALVRYGDTTILFDSGTNADKLEQNVRAMGIDLATVDYAVASHAHADHTGGFDHLLAVNPDVKIYMATDFFGAAGPLSLSIAGKEPSVAEELPRSHRYFEGKTETAQIETTGRFYKAVEYISETTRIAPGVTLIATTSPFIGYFTKYPDVDLSGRPASGEGANLMELPELSLSLETSEGEVLLVGCSHSTVGTIVAATKQATSQPVRLVAGGFHLLPYDREAVAEIVAQLQAHGVKEVAPAHCTGHLAFKMLQDAYADHYRFFGLGERINL